MRFDKLLYVCSFVVLSSCFSRTTTIIKKLIRPRVRFLNFMVTNRRVDSLPRMFTQCHSGTIQDSITLKGPGGKNKNKTYYGIK